MTGTRALSIGPVLFNWTPERWRDFYFRMADEAPADAAYVGEAVCSKRAPFFAPHFEAVVERLRGGGKEVVVSLLAQVTSKIDRRLVLDLAGMEGVTVEVNDAAALASVSGKPHTVGPFLNVYNEDTLCFLAHRGAEVFCLPPELPKQAIAVLGDAAAKHDVQIEVQVFGRIPLALSARCYHARAHGLTKDGCQFVCDRDPDGMTLNTWEGKPFLVINGIQTMSHSCLNLLHEIETLAGLGVSRFRLSPDSHDMVQTAQVFRDVLDGRMNADEACTKLAADRPGVEFSNGFFHKAPGRNGPGTVGLPIVVGGVAVAPGDILVGDADGVVVVPRQLAAAAAAKLVTVRAAEAALEAKVKHGLRLPDFAAALLKSGRIEEME